MLLLSTSSIFCNRFSVCPIEDQDLLLQVHGAVHLKGHQCWGWSGDRGHQSWVCTSVVPGHCVVHPVLEGRSGLGKN